jgi:hypothetical protein
LLAAKQYSDASERPLKPFPIVSWAFWGRGWHRGNQYFLLIIPILAFLERKGEFLALLEKEMAEMGMCGRRGGGVG